MDSDYLCIQTFASKSLFVSWMWSKVCLLFHISYAPSSFTTDALAVSAWMLISTGITFCCVLIIIWWRSQEYLFTGIRSYSAAHEPGTEHNSNADERTPNSNEREQMEWHRCAVVRREQHAYKGSTHSHAPTHTKIYTCIDSSTTQSS